MGLKLTRIDDIETQKAKKGSINWATISLGIKAGPNSNERVDHYIARRIQRTIFAYFNVIHQSHKGERLSFEEGRKTSTGRRYRYNYQTNNGTTLTIDVLCERTPKPDLPDYKVTIELGKMPKRGRYYRLMLEKIKTDLLAELRTEKAQVYAEPAEVR